MATEAQIIANRRNAQKSTGPRTAEGKAVVAQNAVKHGLTGREVVVTGEDPGEFEFYRERRLAELDPIDEIETDLAERIVSLSWRLKRAERLQAAAFDSLYARQKHCPCEPFDSKQDANGGSTLGRALVRDFGDARVLDRLLMYERRIEHSLYRTMAELKKHRILSEVGPGKMWELKRALARDDDAEKGCTADSVAKTDGGEPARSVPVRTYPQSGESKITPYGVTTNEEGRAMQSTAGTLHGVSRKTNPIPTGVATRQVSTTAGVTTASAPIESQKTKPISRYVPVNGSDAVDMGRGSELSCGSVAAEGREYDRKPPWEGRL